MVSALIEGRPIEHRVGLARGKLKQKSEELGASLEGDLSTRHLFVLAHLETHIQTLEQQLAEIDACSLKAMQPYAWAHQLLQTIPGIDKIAAALILIEIGDDMTCFGRAESLANWAALSPGNKQSAGKRKSGRTGHGNASIRFILCECANAARNTKPTLAAKYRRLMLRKPHKKAIIAIAHKMIRKIFLMLSRPSAAGRRQRRLPPALDSPMNSRGRAQRLFLSRNTAGGLFTPGWSGAFTVTGAVRCTAPALRRPCCRLLPFAELVVDQRNQGIQGGLLVIAFGLDLDLAAQACGQHHHAHDALGVDATAIARKVHLALETAR